MALKLRKDIKKSSYYVWFLGAKESQGLRGEEYIAPVIQNLIERERDIEPFKVTLQVSHKGLKIIQNIVTTGVKNSKPKNETIKHFIPHNTITCVIQNEDIVACILLLFNPVTKCPLHVHAYRCDSLETATLLKSQLQILIERPENLKKLNEIEQRLKLVHPPVVKKKFDSSLGSDTGTSTRESDSSEERYSNETRVATLYDSLTAELRHKLGKNDPILLPPRDYDTVHRSKGNLTGIELRRSLNTNIVGMNIKNSRRGLESSGGSSGIGSDHAPSPDGKEENPFTSPDCRYNGMDNQSSSDEDWNHDPVESTLYLMHGTSPTTEPLPRLRVPSTELVRSTEVPSPHRNTDRSYNNDSHGRKSLENGVKPQSKYSTAERISNEDRKYEQHHQKGSNKNSYGYESPGNKYRSYDYPENGEYRSLTREKSSSKYSDSSAKTPERYVAKHRYDKYPERYIENGKSKEEYDDCPRYFDGASPVAMRRRAENRQRSPSPQREIADKLIDTGSTVSPRERFKDAKEKFLSLEKQRIEEQERIAVMRRNQPEKPISPINARHKLPPKIWREEDQVEEQKPRDKSGLKRHESVMYQSPKVEKQVSSRYSDREGRFEENKYDKNEKETYFGRYNETSSPNRYKKEPPRYEEEQRRYIEKETRRYPKNDRYQEENRHIEEKQRYKEERNRYPEERNRYPEEKPRYIEERLDNGRHQTPERYFPKPAPRNVPTEPYRDNFEVPLERYRSPDRYQGDPKRRSMYNVIEDEHKKNSNEIAKEIKRRSYMESTDRYFEDDRYYRNDKKSNGYVEINEHDRFDDYRAPKQDVDKVGRKMPPREPVDVDQNHDGKYVKNSQKAIKNAAGYRHSYAEPKLRMEKIGGKKLFPDILHRTNSTVSNTGRVGIASIHPY